MTQPPAQRPPQRQQPPEQQQQKSPEEAKILDRAQPVQKQRVEEIADATVETQSGMQVTEETRIEGAEGAKNLSYEWVDVWLPQGKPMYIVVKTLSDHDLQVAIEQRSWKKNYAAKGRVQTDVTPIAPIGTTGKLVAKDATSGEELTVKFHWGPLTGPSLFARLVKFVKRLFTNAKD